MKEDDYLKLVQEKSKTLKDTILSNVKKSDNNRISSQDLAGITQSIVEMPLQNYLKLSERLTEEPESDDVFGGATQVRKISPFERYILLKEIRNQLAGSDYTKDADLADRSKLNQIRSTFEQSVLGNKLQAGIGALLKPNPLDHDPELTCEMAQNLCAMTYGFPNASSKQGHPFLSCQSGLGGKCGSPALPKDFSKYLDSNNPKKNECSYFRYMDERPDSHNSNAQALSGAAQ